MKKKVVTALATAAIVSGVGAAGASAATYTVQTGDSLSVIAVKYHTNIADLKKFNSLSSDLILVNQVLTLPNTSSSSQTTTAAAPVTTAFYTVVSGDTLSAIAYRNNISVSDLKSWNNLTSDLIFPGQQLKIAAGTSSAPASTPAVQKPAATASSAYTIQPGDTLSKIAQQFNTTVAALKQLNNLSSDLIYAGDTLKVSGTASVANTASAPKVTAISAPPASSSASGSSTYVVQSGDTLSVIAVQFNTTVANIKNLNHLTSDLIYTGQKLTVSGQAAASTASAPSTSSSSVQDTTSTSSPSSSMVTLLAKKYLGYKYTWGGTSPATGFDCSGFIYYVFNHAGYSIARYTADGYYNRSYEVSNPVPGDLVFFKNTYMQGISHVGIYIGNNQFISAVDETHGVMISSLNSTYFKAHFDSFKRFY